MKHRILLIDDEEHILAAIAEYFTALGYSVDCAADVSTACSLLDERGYGVVITDLRLSRGDRFEGLDVLERARARRPDVSCIVLTAYGQPQNAKQALDRGADAFLQKPTRLDELARLVAALLYRNPAAPCRP